MEIMEVLCVSAKASNIRDPGASVRPGLANVMQQGRPAKPCR